MFIYFVFSRKLSAKFAFLLLGTVRVKGGMSLRNGMWRGLRNDIIMWNVIYAEWPKEIN